LVIVAPQQTIHCTRFISYKATGRQSPAPPGTGAPVCATEISTTVLGKQIGLETIISHFQSPLQSNAAERRVFRKFFTLQAPFPAASMR
jgi:hypothetical protein